MHAPERPDFNTIGRFEFGRKILVVIRDLIESSSLKKDIFHGNFFFVLQYISFAANAIIIYVNNNY